MSPRFRRLALGSAILVWLAGCSTYITEQRPAWRAEAENACLARGAVQESASLRPSQEIGGPGICGLTHPFKVTALAEGTVSLNSTATLDCPMIAALDTWIKEVVQPAAQARFGEPVVRINSMGSYSCRGINNRSGGHLSEHAFGNALDIGGFVLASGRELNIMRGFNGADEQERAFLHEAHAGACGYFTTVLGPGYNIFHYNHFHVDLAMHGSTSRGPRKYCKPVPQTGLPEAPKRDNLPDPPPLDEEMDIARAPVPAPEVGMGGSSLVAAAPAPVSTSRAVAYSPVSRPPAMVAASRSEAVHAHSSAPPPLVTFGGAEEPPPAGPRRLLAHLPEDPGDPGPADLSAADPAAEAEAPPRATEPRSRAKPQEGAPSDWDITSSVR